MSYKILLVDDDASQARVIEQVVNDKLHYETEVLQNGQEAIDKLTGSRCGGVDLVILDLSMPGVDGVQVLNAVRPIQKDLPIIVRTGYDDVDMAVEAMKAGATDFVKKFDTAEMLKQKIDNALRDHVLNDEMSLMKRAGGGQTSFDDLIGESKVLQDVVALGKKVSKSSIPVLLEGENGCGKEFMARAIHADSDRAAKPLIVVNCGAIPENLVESILFGHEKGAFTGAIYKTFGKFREADGGTIFLDEIGELAPDIQVKLLRVLQDGEIDPVGAKAPIKVDVRVISATNRVLAEETKLGNFREDLFYRLNVFPIELPSLRKRNGDILILIHHFIERFAKIEHKDVTNISEEAEEMLCKYHWPGNIRQLKNSIFRAIVLCDTTKLSVDDFPQIMMEMSSEGLGDGGAVDAGALLLDQSGDYRKIYDIEKDIIESALQHYGWRMSEVARKLGIGRSTLYRKLDEYNISHNKDA